MVATETTVRTFYERAIRILLECFLVVFIFPKELKLPQFLDLSPTRFCRKSSETNRNVSTKGVLTSKNQFITRKEMQVTAQVTFRDGTAFLEKKHGHI